MCTVSVVTRKNGYVLAMNRDEQVARGERALAPAISAHGAISSVMPCESSGGTWVAGNSAGVSLALLNWHIPTTVGREQRSRGLIIPELIRFTSQAAMQGALEAGKLATTRPFRLVGVFPGTREICEWRWNTEALQVRWFDWRPNHWFSSGLGDAAALEQRTLAVGRAWKQSAAGSAAWLRRLHRSHRAQPRELAICVHRQGVGTVSYTELTVTPSAVRCRYAAGTPCAGEVPVTLELPRAAAAVRAVS